MRYIGITGAHGLIGWHVRCSFIGHEDTEVRPGGREAFASAEALERFVSDCDAIVHLAGQNRGDDRDLYRCNVGLAQALVNACVATKSTPHILFSSSTHIDRDTAYGASKRAAADIFRSWAQAHGARFTNLVLPHVFGEHGRPFYNSVVHTFCHQLAAGTAPRIDRDGDLRLLHAGSVAALVHERLAQSGDDVCAEVRPAGTDMKVSELRRRLRTFSEQYCGQHLIPDFAAPLDLTLFNTFRSYLFPARYPVALELHKDARGSLFEAVKGGRGGQVFVSTTRPGITRGNHFHYRKMERFLVVRGEAVIRLRRLFHPDVAEFRVSGTQPAYIDMPTLHTHNITNIGGNELLTLFWAHEVFDPEQPDTQWEDV